MKDFSLLPCRSQDAPVVLKWVGSKGPLAPHLCSLLLPSLQKGGRFFEPFAGSLATFFHLRCYGWRGAALLSDVLDRLINFYQTLYVFPEEIFIICSKIEAAYNNSQAKKDYYKQKRSLMNEGSGGPTYQAGLFWWINHRAYNGLWRTNAKKEMNTDWGGERTYLPSLSRLTAASKLLDNTEIHCQDFGASISLAGAGDVVYADPPYAVGYRYYAGSFNAKHQERLAGCLHEAFQRGALIVSSNADTPEIRALYSWAEIKPIKLQYTIGGATHKTGNEVLIVGSPAMRHP